MSDEQIIELAKAHGFGLYLYGPIKLHDNGDGIMCFRIPDDLTPCGKKLLSFARAVEAISGKVN
ncbi:MAG: hypothetical protein FD174_2612 [Geobacteraceae bacterium]|nr:MAG: hypothetical protein FD174_2612 [Geobacteraceae bacterium]